MAVTHSAIFTAIWAAGLLAVVTVGMTMSPPGGECEARLTQGLFTCFQEHDVPFNAFLYTLTNGSGGVAPDNVTVFSDVICGAERSVVQCALGTLHGLVDTDWCREVKGMKRLLTVQIRTVFEEYDNFCAHECRGTLEADMRACYADLGLDGSFFMPANKDGAILGATQDSVTDICKSRDALTACLTEKRDACPEAPYVLKRLGLDLEVFTTGIDVLCQQQETYLSSLDCFEAQTRGVEKCAEDNHLALLSLLARSKDEGVAQARVLRQFCQLRLEYVRCDLGAWAAKTDGSCSAPALNLKRDLHCAQVPEACEAELSEAREETCKRDWRPSSLPAFKRRTAHSGALPTEPLPSLALVVVSAIPILATSLTL